MKTDFGHSIELDAIDASSEPVSTAHPVVMVQYRDRGVPLWILIPLVIIVPMCAILVYHRLVVLNYRKQAEARLALERQIDAGQTVVSQPIETKTAEPLARNSQPIAAGSMAPDPTPGPGSTSSSLPIPKVATPPVVVDSPAAPIGSPAPSPVATALKSSDSVAQNPVVGQPKMSFSSVPAAGSTPTTDQKPVTADNKSSTSPQSIVANPTINPEKPEKPAAPAEVADRAVAGENASAKATGSLEDSRGATALKPAESAAEPADTFPGDAADVKAEPLPTKAETLRQIAAESAKKQAELNRFEENKQTEFRSIRQTERVKFRDELREVLQTFGDDVPPDRKSTSWPSVTDTTLTARDGSGLTITGNFRPSL